MLHNSIRFFGELARLASPLPHGISTMGQRRHVLLLCFPAFGHYLPTVELAKKIFPFHDVTIAISSSKQAGIIEKNVAPPSDIPLVFVDDKVTVSFDAPLGILDYVSTVRAMEPFYQQFVENVLEQNRSSSKAELRPIHAVIWDYALNLPAASTSWNIPVYVFSSQSATVMFEWLTMTSDTPTIPDSAFLTDAEKIPDDKLHLMPESIRDLWMEKSPSLCNATALVVNSFHDLEPEIVTKFAEHPNTSRLPVKFTGPILAEPRPNQSNQVQQQNLEKWLDRQEKAVVYVSLGTIALASPEQLKEIGEALLSLDTPFVWALRSEQQNLLPAIFSKSHGTSFPLDSPYLILPWVPQQIILKHHATAAFISHCGWNSTLEAVSYGVPVVGLPLFADQHDNAAMLACWGVGIKLAPLSGFQGARVTTAHELASAVRKIMTPKGQDPTSYSTRVEFLSKQAQEALLGESANTFLELMDRLTE